MKDKIKIEFIKLCRAWFAIGNCTCKACPFWGDGKIDSSPCNSAKSVYTKKNVETLQKEFEKYVMTKYFKEFEE